MSEHSFSAGEKRMLDPGVLASLPEDVALFALERFVAQITQEGEAKK